MTRRIHAMIPGWLNSLSPKVYTALAISLAVAVITLAFWWTWRSLEAGNWWAVASVLVLAGIMLAILLRMVWR